jgi:DNA-binding HxlR family transcriptional regulator
MSNSMQTTTRPAHPITSTIFAHLGNKWAPSILVELRYGRRRYSELRARILGISEKMLAQTLRELERDGLVLRTVTHVVPPQVSYDLTMLGAECAAFVADLVGWLEGNMSALEHAQHAYDSRATGTAA